jgi:phenol hydroxylase P2 protein
MSNVFIAFQANEESRPLVDAIVADNPEAQVVYSPGLVKIDAPGRLVIKRETIEEITGSKYDLQQLQINLVTLSGNLDEDDDQFVLSWKH